MGLLDAISPTPRNRILGLLADATHGVNDFASKPFGYDNPPARMLMGLLGVPSIATTLDRLSYGEPLTNIGKANVPLLKPETADAAMAAAAALPAVSRGALKASDAAVQAITKNPQATATKVMDYAAQMNPANPMVVWHGSPHKFDKFDSSKIGTGEGAQAYGHGLYLAESPETAMSYRASVTAEKGKQFGLEDGPIKGIATLIAARGQKGEEMARKAYANSVPDIDLAITKAKSAINDASSLYKVDLPDSAIAKMLDYDNPVPEAMRQPLSSAALNSFGSGLSGTSGRHLYNEVVFEFKNAGHPNPSAAATEWLRSQGVPGIRYLDGGSRGAGAGTSNFVVFPGNEGLLSILERNGVPLK